MLVKNLELSFDRQDKGKIILRAESGAEVSLDDYLLNNFVAHDKKVYLSIDHSPLVSSEETQKELLNEILDNQE